MEEGRIESSLVSLEAQIRRALRRADYLFCRKKCSQMLQRHPKSTFALSRRAVCNRFLGESRAVDADCAQLESIDPDNPIPLCLRVDCFADPWGAVRNCTKAFLCEKMHDAYSDLRMWPFVLRGMAYSQIGSWEAARSDFLYVLKRDAANAHALIGLSEYFGKEGKYDEIYSVADYAIRLDTNNPMLRVVRGYAAANLGSHEEAVEDFSFVLSLDQRSIPLLMARGESLCALNCFEEANSDISKALDLMQSDEEAAKYEEHLSSLRHTIEEGSEEVACRDEERPEEHQPPCPMECS
jgi:hypothetical protein